MVSFFSISVEFSDISRGEVVDETSLHIFNFLASVRISVVSNGVVNESIVKGSFEEQFEVRHDVGGVTVLVLSKDSLETVVTLSKFAIINSLLGETEEELNHSAESKTPEVSQHTMLKHNNISHAIFKVISPTRCKSSDIYLLQSRSCPFS